MEITNLQLGDHILLRNAPIGSICGLPKYKMNVLTIHPLNSKKLRLYLILSNPLHINIWNLLYVGTGKIVNKTNEFKEKICSFKYFSDEDSNLEAIYLGMLPILKYK